GWFRRFLDEFLKTRIVTKRIPVRVQTQLSIAEMTRDFQQTRQFLKCKILFAGPRINDGKKRHQLCAGHRVPCDWQKFDGASALSQGLFLAAKTGINHSKHAERFSVVGLLSYDFFYLGTCSGECSACGDRIAPSARCYP